MQRVWSTYLDRTHQSTASLIPPVPSRPQPELETMDNSEHRRRSSSLSHSHSIQSAANSTRYMLADYSQSPLDPPSAPFRNASASGSIRSMSPGSEVSGPVSLSINYLPSKFSQQGFHKRKTGKGGQLLPKRGGGREAFRSGEARMPGDGDEDYDGVQGFFGGKEGGRTKARLRWTKFKWILFVANTLLSLYSIVALIFCLLTWFNVWTHADVVRVGNAPELIVSTVAASFGVVTSLIGWSGILLNNRSFLAWYTFMLWGCFALLVIPGYITYKRREFNLEGKINAEWSQDLGQNGRLRIQNQLQCCGYFSPFVEATVSQTCYSRSTLPGCKGPYLKFERRVLERWYIIAFALVPFQIFVIVSGLLCSNHVTYRFGKGMMPKAYRLSMNSMAVIMDNYANQLAEQYGADVATDVLARSRSNLHLDTMPPMPYSTNDTPTQSSFNQGNYGTLNVNTPGAEDFSRRRAPYEGHTPPGTEYQYTGSGSGPEWKR